MFVEFQWFWVTFGGHVGVILRSRGALGSKMAPRGVGVEKGRAAGEEPPVESSDRFETILKITSL